MKHARMATVVAATLILLLAIFVMTGCGGGNKTHTVDTPWYGDLYGVDTQPSDGETGIDTSRESSWIHVYWPDAHYPPPAQFTMTLEKEETPDNWSGIHTTLSDADSDPAGGSWWFQPDNDMSPGTWYRIVITAPGVEHPAIAYFKTAGTKGAVSALTTQSVEPGKGYKPANASKTPAAGESAVVHTITK